jgi:phage N-6-adenine-methyltransferase
LRLSTAVDILPTSERQARPLAGLSPELQREVWQKAVETAPNGRVTGSFVGSVAAEYLQKNWNDSDLRFNPESQKAYCKYCYQTHSNWELSAVHANPMCWECLHCNHFSSDAHLEIEKKTTPHVSHNSGENEWYTPEHLIDAARRAMGSIDTDPASSELANKTVKAKTYYTEEQDGRDKAWGGNVWMNPPYSQPLITEFVSVFAEKYNAGEFNQACVLVNNATETNWYQSLLTYASAVCFLKGRVKFIDKNGNPSGAPLQGQTVLYFGNKEKSFIDAFSEFGIILYGRNN